MRFISMGISEWIEYVWNIKFHWITSWRLKADSKEMIGDDLIWKIGGMKKMKMKNIIVKATGTKPKSSWNTYNYYSMRFGLINIQSNKNSKKRNKIKGAYSNIKII